MVKIDGGSELLREIELMDHSPLNESLESPQWTNSYKFSVPPGSYSDLRFGVGVRSDLNSKDPTTLPNEDPQSLYGGMHWTWATMFKFIVFYAKIDTLGGNDITHDVTFETGLDSLYRPSIEFPVNLDVESFDRDTIRLVIDWNTIFHGSDPIDLKDDNVSHTFGSVEDAQLAVRFTDNFVKAIRKD